MAIFGMFQGKSKIKIKKNKHPFHIQNFFFIPNLKKQVLLLYQ